KIIQDVPGEPTSGPHNPYRPIVQPGYFHFIGTAVFAEPLIDDSAPGTFSVHGLPRGGGFASDFGQKPVRARDELVENVLVGGDFRVVSRPGPGGFLRVALRGNSWKFSDDHIADQIARIVASHNKFWRDPDERFLVTILPLKNPSGGTSLGGTGRGDAFAFF